jgi:lipopolysaccharide transport system permease protein
MINPPPARIHDPGMTRARELSELQQSGESRPVQGPPPQAHDPGPPPSNHPSALIVTVNEPPHGVLLPDLGAIVRSREVLYFLTWRDVKVRYKQTAIGAAWAILQPLTAMLIFTLVFNRLAKLPSDDVPYPVFAYCALVPWTFFATAITQASASLIQNERLITRIYFPRLIIPLASVCAVLLDLALASVVLVALMIVYGIMPTLGVIWIPAFVLVAAAAAIGIGALLAALNVRYRDVRYVIPFLVQLWIFITPVAYSTSLVPGRWRWVYALNPMVGVVEGFRWAFFGSAISGRDLSISIVTAVLLLFAGLLVFGRMEDTFADEI